MKQPEPIIAMLHSSQKKGPLQNKRPNKVQIKELKSLLA
ncbi:hypothetical protein A1122_07280 [Yersinia pestis A1122]|uniref:Uncharacterized protein n=1 Tax=Yersinia pseudotuberculosis serotype O:3 (strain YPIII) TaxID=502800 RepID=A0A0H3AZD0_YERPY|nr:hypothetical protein A1122_07280 [Yersinia pestis A1122]EIR27295.1 hypothetical protein YPPY10_4275 [Yersinia pestis PY-10]EIR83323.1 hypothetical protein YPPY36_4385 [Yersinia pestis PY-36]EKS43705.1 hypothetical protein INS_19262 [Yersinia pestis INS]ERP79324.1 hypothetical protein L328_18430 [Yersinia pestis 24H]ERP79564.1 hypothetical protein L327_18490 [Yersinia pestis S3]ERP80666.1 hypothetical protein L326_18325 [Yersinia pestis 113]ERP84629.1 hypothetical protein L325_18420 [Yersi